MKSDERLLTFRNSSLQLLHNSAYCEAPANHETHNCLHTSASSTRETDLANDYFRILLPLIEYVFYIVLVSPLLKLAW